MAKTPSESRIIIPPVLYRGDRRLRIALVGLPGSGKSTLFNAVSSTSIHRGKLVGAEHDFNECRVQIGLDEASLIDLPSLHSLHHLEGDDLAGLKYLLWGDGDTSLPPPDAIIQIIDATALERHLELSLELAQLGHPMVIALNMMDQAREKGLHIHCARLSRLLGIPVVPTTALMGKGIAELFTTVVDAVRKRACPLPQRPSEHLQHAMLPLGQVLNTRDIQSTFNIPQAFLLAQVAMGDRYFISELARQFPEQTEKIQQLRSVADAALPRPLPDELHADRHHRAASLFEAVARLGGPSTGRSWRYWLDELFLHPRWGLLGSLGVFAAVLFVVFEVSTWLDSVTAARLVELTAAWEPATTGGVVARAITDGLIGLIGIVIPYMIPLVLLLVALEESGIMHRIAFVVDRWFHHLGLHGGVAVSFLLGLGCNVPAISAAASSTRGRERVLASILITFVPCSARSAIILALAGKYLGGLGIFAIFMLTLVVIAIMGQLLGRRYASAAPGQVQEIPAYAMPGLRDMLATTWHRTSDILTIVTPLLVGGSVVLALLGHFDADELINTGLTPVTNWWLGLPVALGVPILFGILRKELSLLMIYQALGTFEIAQYLDWVQITTFLIFLTFYIPCISTFAVMLRTIGYRNALLSISLSVTVALVISGIVRAMLELSRYLFA